MGYNKKDAGIRVPASFMYSKINFLLRILCNVL